MKHKRSVMSIALAIIVLVSLCAVYMSTSVTAVSSSANAKTSVSEISRAPSSASRSANTADPNLSHTSAKAVAESSATAKSVSNALVAAPPPYGMVGAPGVDCPFGNSLDIFVRGTDGNIWWKNVTGGSWQGWRSIGKPSVGVTSSPSAAARGNEIWIAVRGGDGALWRTVSYNRGAAWSAWETRGGSILAGTGPSVFNYSVGGGAVNIGYAATGASTHQVYLWLGGTSWRSLGGYATSSPSGISWTANGIDIKVRGSSGAVYYKDSYDTGGTWPATWSSLGGSILAGTNPASAVKLSGSPLGTAATSTSNQLRWWDGSTWQNRNGYLTSSPDSESFSNINDILVVARGGGGNDPWLLESVTSGSSWLPWMNTSLH